MSKHDKRRSAVGRPTDYNKRIAQRICEVVSTTSTGINRLCQENPDFPSAVTIYRWIHKYEEFRKQYATAKDQQLQVLADEITEISNTPVLGRTVKKYRDSHGNKHRDVTYGDMTNHRKLQIDARKWILAKLQPKKYGDRIEIDQGADPLIELIASMKKEGKRVGPPPSSSEEE